MSLAHAVPLAEANIDHGSIAGLIDDDHTQYILEDGTRAFSGNQSFGGNDITNVVNITSTGKLTMGTTPTTNTDPWFNKTGGTHIQIGAGTSAVPLTTSNATVYIEKYTASNTDQGDEGALHAKVIRRAGANKSTGAATFTAIKEAAGDFATYGIHSRVRNESVMTGGGQGIWGAWIFARHEGGDGSGIIHGIEVNLSESSVFSSGDAGHWDDIGSNANANQMYGIWVSSHESGIDCTLGLGFNGDSVSRWHSGILFTVDSIVPEASGKNEAILSQGGSDASNDHVFARLVGFHYRGLEFSGTTFDSNRAIDLANSHRITWGTATTYITAIGPQIRLEGGSSGNAMLLINSDSSTNTSASIQNFTTTVNAGSGITFTRGRGTQASPAAVQSGDRLGFFLAAGYNSPTTLKTAAAITFFADENFTGSAAGASIYLETTPLGSTTRAKRVRITADGYAVISGKNSAPADALLFNSSYVVWLDEGTDEINFKAKKSGGGLFTATIGIGGGEANTASNTGSQGQGLFKGKTGVNLAFYRIASTNDRIKFALTGTDYIQLTFDDAKVTDGLINVTRVNNHEVITEGLEINKHGSGNRTSRIDFHAEDAIYTDYAFRLIRNSGVNGTSDITHRGTGALRLRNMEAAGIEFKTSDTVRFQITSGGTPQVETILKIKERAAASGDTAGYGQIWVKNTTPAELWYTDDAGTDTQIV